MKYKNTVRGIFKDRPNRFIAHVRIGDKLETVHVKNTGRCRELLVPDVEVILEKNDNPKIYMATTKAKHVYSAPAYEEDEDVYIMFGKESAGIPEEILLDYEETSIRIPMLPHIRSLNLSNSVAIVAYEVLRHQGFEAFQMEGQLHHYHW